MGQHVILEAAALYMLLWRIFSDINHQNALTVKITVDVDTVLNTHSLLLINSSSTKLFCVRICNLNQLCNI